MFALLMLASYLGADTVLAGAESNAGSFLVEDPTNKGQSSCLGYTTQDLPFGSRRFRVILGDQSGKASESCRTSTGTAEPTFLIGSIDVDEAVSVFELFQLCLAAENKCGMIPSDLSSLRKVMVGRKIFALGALFNSAVPFTLYACSNYRPKLEECSIVGFKFKNGVASELDIYRVMDQ